MAVRSRLRLFKPPERERFIEGNRATLLRDGTQAFPEMLAAIDTADRQVLLEMYWFDSDRTGRRFAEALKMARSRGCEVALIYDALGSITADGGMFADLKSHGIHVVDYNPVAPWRQRFAPARLTRRNHRKMLLVDGRVAFTGGFNLADRWLPSTASGEQPWREDVVRLEGPVLDALIAAFHDSWVHSGGQPMLSNVAASSKSVGSQRVQVLAQNYLRNRLEIGRAYRQRIAQAAQRIWITNAYFVPDQSVIDSLVRAARRGVDVRVLVPKISDVPLITYASKACWPKLLEGGVRIFEWQDNVLHSKSAVIDGYWSTLGSFNLDYLSLLVNLELNVAVLDEEFARAMQGSFEADLQHSREVIAGEFAQRTALERAAERVLYRLRKLL